MRFYIIEDIGDDLNSLEAFKKNPELLKPETKTILQNNHAMLIDPNKGHPKGDEYFQLGKNSYQNATHDFHMCFVLVIRKAKDEANNKPLNLKQYINTI